MRFGRSRAHATIFIAVYPAIEQLMKIIALVTISIRLIRVVMPVPWSMLGIDSDNDLILRARAVDSTQIKTAGRGFRLQPFVRRFYHA